MWPHRPAQAVLGGIAGVLGLVLSPLAALRPSLGRWLALIGGALALSLLVFPDALITSVDNLLMGFVLLLAGFLPAETTPVPAAAAAGAGPEAGNARIRLM
jgi:hypothetical protein